MKESVLATIGAILAALFVAGLASAGGGSSETATQTFNVPGVSG